MCARSGRRSRMDGLQRQHPLFEGVGEQECAALGASVLIGSQHDLDEAVLAIDADDLAVAERLVEHRVAGFERGEGRPRVRCLCWCCDSRFAPDGRSLGAIECSSWLTELRFIVPFHVLEPCGAL